MNIVKLKLEHVLENMHMFNSGPHPPDSLLTTLPSLGVQEPPETSLTRYGFWYPLILGTQHVNRRKLKVVDLTPSYSRLLIGASESGTTTGRVPESYEPDLLESGLFNKLFETLLCSPQGYFLRFDTASAQDSVHAPRALKSPADVIERIVTSQQAINAIRECFNESQPIRHYFVPFDASFDTRNEYRCFSAPVSPVCKTQKVTAVSQYRWTERGYHRSTGKFMTALLERIHTLHRNILDYAQLFSPKVAQGLRDEGFVFDVRCLRGGEVQLIDLNGFGIASRCGSALFHWITDAELLYGGKDEVEIRVVCRKTKREHLRFWK